MITRSFNLLIIFAMMIFQSCHDDESAKDKELSHAFFYNEKYALTDGAIYEFDYNVVLAMSPYEFKDNYMWNGEAFTDNLAGFTSNQLNQSSGNFMIGLYGEGLTVNTFTHKAQGKGCAICLRLASSDLEKLVEGKYTFSKTKEGNTFYGYASVNYDTGELDPSFGTEINAAEIVEGEVYITKKNNMYIITFDCKTTVGARINGTYENVMPQYKINNNEVCTVVKDVAIEALFPIINYTVNGTNIEEPDYLRAESFSNSANGDLYTANNYAVLSDTKKDNIDVALRYNPEDETITFDSPIKMRSYLWHNKFNALNFDLACHSSYLLAQEDITTEIYENLNSQTDFNYEIPIESVATFNIHTELPLYIKFQSGTGRKGVFNIYNIEPATTELVNGVIHMKNPIVYMDIKYPGSVEEIMR